MLGRSVGIVMVWVRGTIKEGKERGAGRNKCGRALGKGERI